MLATNTVSAVAVLIPLVSGTAGALNLVQSERSSLVSGAAAGMLVSVSLAPPAALVGMAIARSIEQRRRSLSQIFDSIEFILISIFFKTYFLTCGRF
jgi:uncharacterized membrane protein